ncbi:MAG: DUF1611 domain-containing protein [Planctomycetota bacterium]|nr:DUF1611 domain-containing protein [Planctomycetota bacterium]MDA1177165.1 DUF1611 domain-containing protein [Planctomycetota bacterium]
MARRAVILTEGHTNPHTAKTASCVIRYQPDDVVALLDSTQAGSTSQQLLGVGGDLPVVSKLADAPQADTLLIGIAPPGGNIPPAWRATILEAIRRGMNVASGLHDFLQDDPEFSAAARASGSQLHDVRRSSFRKVSRRQGLTDKCFRVHTVGHDCSVGKMVAGVELTRALEARGHDAKFIATGQTGIMIEGDGLPIDALVSDFVAGAAESMVKENQHREFVVVEGQGSLVHPSYSGVTLSLLHGCFPHVMILVYEVGRTHVTGLDNVPIPPLKTIREMFETMGGIWRPCPVVGVAMNSRRVTVAEADEERKRVSKELNLPVCDVFRHGSDELINAILSARDKFNAQPA